MQDEETRGEIRFEPGASHEEFLANMLAHLREAAARLQNPAFGRGGEEGDQVGMLSEKERAIFGRSYAAEPDVLIEQLKQDEAIAEADTLLLTVPNQLGVDYNAHVIEAILKHVAPGLGWR